jgi:hypothetical protein
MELDECCYINKELTNVDKKGTKKLKGESNKLTIDGYL